MHVETRLWINVVDLSQPAGYLQCTIRPPVGGSDKNNSNTSIDRSFSRWRPLDIVKAKANVSKYDRRKRIDKSELIASKIYSPTPNNRSMNKDEFHNRDAVNLRCIKYHMPAAAKRYLYDEPGFDLF